MNRRIRMGRGAMFLYVVLAFGFCIAICNFSTLLLIRSQPKVLSSYGPDRRVEPVINMAMDPDQGVGLNRLKFHVAVTATDSLYSKWQCRIMYYWYKRVKDLPGSDMGGFTRVLHSGHSDTLMEEIPSFVVDPLPEGVDQGELTYGKITDWHFDKRSFQDGPPPKDLTLPPPGAPETVVRLMSMVNEATAKIPGWENL